MNRPFNRLVSLSLAVLIPSSGLAQTVPGSLATAPLGAASAAAGASGAALSQRVLSAVNFHLDSAALSLPVSPALAPVSRPQAVTYLAKAALATAPQAQTLSAESQAARFLTAALADPIQRAAAVAALRAQGAEGIAAAEKIEKLAPSVSGLESLRKLNEDFQRVPSGERLAQFFSGSKASLASPEEFASYAERLFHPGLTEGNAAVAYRLQKNRPEGVAGDQELQDEVAVSPLTNAERERAVVELFKQAGAKAEEIKLQDAGRGHNNIYVVKRGRTDRVVVVGGHHDKVEGDGGYGLIDNWTGAAMVTNLYQALRDVDTEATYVFIAFAREEEGLIGSSRYLDALSKQEKLKIDSMVNLDTLGVDGTYSWKNNSTKSLLDMVKRVAVAAKLGLTEVSFWGGDADSSSFRKAGIPAITLFGASESVIWDVIHGVGDCLKAFSLPDYKNTYLLTIALLKQLDAQPVRPLERLARLASDLARKLF